MQIGLEKCREVDRKIAALSSKYQGAVRVRVILCLYYWDV